MWQPASIAARQCSRRYQETAATMATSAATVPNGLVERVIALHRQDGKLYRNGLVSGLGGIDDGHRLEHRVLADTVDPMPPAGSRSDEDNAMGHGLTSPDDRRPVLSEGRSMSPATPAGTGRWRRCAPKSSRLP
jgi:hypothetical protein